MAEIRKRRELPTLSLSEITAAKAGTGSGKLLSGVEGDSRGRRGAQDQISKHDCIEDTPISPFTGAFELGRTLGSGTMSVVKLATRRSNGRQVAIKCIRSMDEEIRQFTRDEFELVRTLSHPAIIHFDALYENEFIVRICMESCSEGSVESYVRQHGIFNELCGQILSLQMLRGVNYLHHRRVVHRDLKPANLLLKDATVLKITDFNSAKKIGKHMDMMLTDRGTRQYSAPELRFGRLWNERIDIWACGLCLYFMLRAKIPFNNQETHVAQMLSRGELPTVDWDGITDPMRNLIGQCLIVDMHDRPPAMELLVHPIFRMTSMACQGKALANRPNDNYKGGKNISKLHLPMDVFELLPACGLISLGTVHSSQGVSPMIPMWTRWTTIPLSKPSRHSGPATMYLFEFPGTPQSGTPQSADGEMPGVSSWKKSYTSWKEPRHFDALLQLADNKYEQQHVFTTQAV